VRDQAGGPDRHIVIEQNERLFRRLLGKEFCHLFVMRWAQVVTERLEQPFSDGGGHCRIVGDGDDPVVHTRAG
jgi:hypothetical protein